MRVMDVLVSWDKYLIVQFFIIFAYGFNYRVQNQVVSNPIT